MTSTPLSLDVIHVHRAIVQVSKGCAPAKIHFAAFHCIFTTLHLLSPSVDPPRSIPERVMAARSSWVGRFGCRECYRRAVIVFSGVNSIANSGGKSRPRKAAAAPPICMYVQTTDCDVADVCLVLRRGPRGGQCGLASSLTLLVVASTLPSSSRLKHTRSHPVWLLSLISTAPTTTMMRQQHPPRPPTGPPPHHHMLHPLHHRPIVTPGGPTPPGPSLFFFRGPPPPPLFPPFGGAIPPHPPIPLPPLPSPSSSPSRPPPDPMTPTRSHYEVLGVDTAATTVESEWQGPAAADTK